MPYVYILLKILLAGADSDILPIPKLPYAIRLNLHRKDNPTYTPTHTTYGQGIIRVTQSLSLPYVYKGVAPAERLSLSLGKSLSSDRVHTPTRVQKDWIESR